MKLIYILLHYSSTCNKMYIRIKSIWLLLAGSVILLLASCAKNSYSHKYNNSYRSYSQSAYPVSQKSTPVVKKYVIPGRKKAVLGQDGRFLK